MSHYLRPLVQIGAARPRGAHCLAGGWGWFTHVEVLSRDHAAVICPADEFDAQALRPLTDPRADIAGLTMARPQIMGIVNTTPDSFSDGGKHAAAPDAVRAAGDVGRRGRPAGHWRGIHPPRCRNSASGCRNQTHRAGLGRATQRGGYCTFVAGYPQGRCGAGRDRCGGHADQ